MRVRLRSPSRLRGTADDGDTWERIRSTRPPCFSASSLKQSTQKHMAGGLPCLSGSTKSSVTIAESPFIERGPPFPRWRAAFNFSTIALVEVAIERQAVCRQLGRTTARRRFSESEEQVRSDRPDDEHDTTRDTAQEHMPTCIMHMARHTHSSRMHDDVPRSAPCLS